MPNNATTRDFGNLLEGEVDIKISDNVLETVTQWIESNMTPGEVFTEDQLRGHVGKTSLPQDVFTEKELGEWAENNGYTKE